MWAWGALDLGAFCGKMHEIPGRLRWRDRRRQSGIGGDSALPPLTLAPSRSAACLCAFLALAGCKQRRVDAGSSLSGELPARPPAGLLPASPAPAVAGTPPAGALLADIAAMPAGPLPAGPLPAGPPSAGSRPAGPPPAASGPAAEAAVAAVAASAASAASVPVREPVNLSELDRGNGYWECMLPDPGMGHYAPMRQVPLGWVFIPKKGGHTGDMGFDVLVHFHGFQAVRKSIVGLPTGVVLAGFELGTSSGAYADKVSPLLFESIRASITTALRAQTKDDRAHIRHLALTAWSAGYAAVNRILRGGDQGIDAVVLLDGLHTGYLNPTPEEPQPLDVASLEPILAFAERAAAGEKIFFFTHSEVGTNTYASTTKTANLLLSRLKLAPTPGPPTKDPYGLTSFVQQKGLYVRGYGGANEAAHCDQVRFMRDAVHEVLEPAWGTPPATD